MLVAESASGAPKPLLLAVEPKLPCATFMFERKNSDALEACANAVIDIVAAFDASFEGLYFSEDTFNPDFFIEQARAVILDFESEGNK